MVSQQVSFVERLSLSQRVPYRRFHCIVAGNVHIVCVTVSTPCPAAEVHAALKQELAVGGREEVGTEDDK